MKNTRPHRKMYSPPVVIEKWEQTNSEQFWLALSSYSAVRENKTMIVSHSILVSLNTTWTRPTIIIKRVSSSFASLITALTVSLNNRYLSIFTFSYKLYDFKRTQAGLVGVDVRNGKVKHHWLVLLRKVVLPKEESLAGKIPRRKNSGLLIDKVKTPEIRFP